MDDRDAARFNGIGRAVLGAGLVLAPGLVARGWIGGDASSAGPKVIARALGIRDVALGAGLIWALQNDEPIQTWVAGAAAADAIDAAATALAGSDLPRLGRLGVFALAATSAVQMGMIARRTA